MRHVTSDQFFLEREVLRRSQSILINEVARLEAEEGSIDGREWEKERDER